MPALPTAAVSEALTAADCNDLSTAERTVAAPLRGALAIRKQCATAGPPIALPRKKTSLPKAIGVAERAPQFETIREAIAGLEDAIATPLQHHEAVLIVAAMLDAFGKRATDGVKAQVLALASVFTDDEITEVLGAEAATASSPLIAVLAAKRIVRTTKFDPKPIELLDAARAVRGRIDRLIAELEHSLDVRDAADNVLLDFADKKTLARVAPELLEDEQGGIPWE